MMNSSIRLITDQQISEVYQAIATIVPWAAPARAERNSI